MFDCSDCDRDKIGSRDNIYNFVKTMIERIDMVAVGEPVIEMLCEGDPKVGYSLMQLISTSNITGHFLDITGAVYIDVFSCKTYDSEIAERCIREFFNPGAVHKMHVIRNAGNYPRVVPRF
jgi:S-adenosylmethionine/arginine decarboxylase-like enzyme